MILQLIEGLDLSRVGISSGWALVCVVVVMIFRGDLVTKREASAMERHLEAARARDVVKDQTIAEFTTAIDTSNALIRAVLDVAEERAS